MGHVSTSALRFVDASSDGVNVGNSQGSDPVIATVFGWVFPSSLTNNARLFVKGSVAGNTGFFNFTVGNAGTNRLRLTIDYVTTDAQAQSADNFLTVGVWQFVATTVDGTNAPKLYRGGPSQGLAEPTSYATSTANSGARVTDGGQAFNIGNTVVAATQNLAWGGDIACLGYTNGLVASVTDLIDLMQRPRAWRGGSFWRLGSNGTGLVVDEGASRSTGTITGAKPVTHALPGIR